MSDYNDNGDDNSSSNARSIDSRTLSSDNKNDSAESKPLIDSFSSTKATATATSTYSSRSSRMFTRLWRSRYCLVIMASSFLCIIFIWYMQIYTAKTTTNNNNMPLLKINNNNTNNNNNNNSNNNNSTQTLRGDGFNYNGASKCANLSPHSLGDFRKRLPLVVLLGMQKGGTKALHSYLREHPLAGCYMRHELHFFDNKSQVARTSTGAVDQTETRRRYKQEFKKNFDCIQDNPSLFALDDSPRYLLFSTNIPDALFCTAPWARPIALVRNPIDRIVSAFNMYTGFRNKKHSKTLGWDHFLSHDIQLLKDTGVVQDWSVVDFDSFAGSEAEFQAWSNYTNQKKKTLPIGRGMYAIMLEHYFAKLEEYGRPRSDLLVIQSENMKTDIQGVFDRVLDFLDLPPHKLRTAEVKHKTTPAKPLPDHWRKVLEEIYEPYNQRLYRLLNWDPVWG